MTFVREFTACFVLRFIVVVVGHVFFGHGWLVSSLLLVLPLGLWLSSVIVVANRASFVVWLLATIAIVGRVSFMVI
jgi:hypothetical protein